MEGGIIKASRWSKLLMAGMMLGLLPAHAAAGDAPAPGAVASSDHVSLRLVTEEPGPGGSFRGAILVRLDPGWKTYWLDPGDAGIPPSIDFSASRNLARAEPRFPAPVRFKDGYGQSIGYADSMAIAVEFTAAEPDRDTRIKAELLIGVCKNICIPVTAQLEASAASSGEADAAELVEAAFDALPAASGALSGRILAASFSPGKETLNFVAELPTGSGSHRPDVFVRGPKGWFFGPPDTIRRDGRQATITVPVLERPRGAASPPLKIDVLVTLAEAAFEAQGIAPDGAP